MKFKIIAWNLLITTSLVFNLTVLASFCYYLAIRDSSFLGYARDLAREMKGAVYVIQSPFAILVDKSNPNKRSILLINKEKSDILLQMEGYGKEDTNSIVKITIGRDYKTDFYFRCKTHGNATNYVYEYAISRGATTYSDLNADGAIDQKINSNTNVNILFNGQWQNVDLEAKRNGKYKKRLSDGRNVLFNREKGVWEINVEETTGSNNDLQ